MSIDFNCLQNHNAIPAIYGIFLPGYKPPEIFVPFSHSRPVLFSSRKNRSPAARMAGIALLLWIAIFVFPAPAVRAEVLSLEQLTAKTQEVYEKTTDLKARFIQEVTIKSMKKTEREEGTVWFKNPKMMFWDYAKPKEKKLVINARKAWLYVAEDRMVYVQNAEDVYRSRMVVKFLSGIGKLSEDFQLRFAKDNPLDEEGNYLLTLTAKEKGTGIDRLKSDRRRENLPDPPMPFQRHLREHHAPPLQRHPHEHGRFRQVLHLQAARRRRSRQHASVGSAPGFPGREICK